GGGLAIRIVLLEARQHLHDNAVARVPRADPVAVDQADGSRSTAHGPGPALTGRDVVTEDGDRAVAHPLGPRHVRDRDHGIQVHRAALRRAERYVLAPAREEQAATAAVLQPVGTGNADDPSLVAAKGAKGARV